MRSLIGDLFELDSRLWRSLISLLVKPGFLTKEYLNGKRAYYTPPLRMYLVLSIVFFLLASIGNDINISAGDWEAELTSGTRITSKEEALQWCDEVEIDGIIGQDTIRNNLKKRCKETVNAGPAQFIKEVSENIPKMLFFFLPLMAGVMKVFYIGSRRYYVEHLLFFVHIHSALFLMLSVSLVAGNLLEPVAFLDWIPPILAFAIMIYTPIYLWRALYHVYGQHFLIRLPKYVLLVMSYFVCALSTFLLGLVFTAAL
ncbi:MAG: DUF3667 domain-containing protein [Pseudomonadota bacterium]